MSQPPPATDRPQPKVAERLAQRIIDDIDRDDWPIGRVLGTEPELIERYGVSRNAFRESVRLLEHLNAARMRAGRGGGLVVTRPEMAPVTKASAIYLRHAGVGIDELYGARSTLEASLVVQAIDHLDASAERRLMSAARDEIDFDPEELPSDTSRFHMTIADIAQSRPLGLFLQTLISLSDEYSRPRLAGGINAGIGDDVEQMHQAHVAIAEAMIARKPVVAVRRMNLHLEAVQRWMR